MYIKGEVSHEFDVISKPKIVCLLTETKKRQLLLSFVIISPEWNKNID